MEKIKKNDVLVSICCTVYNHANFIRECLDGFLMQKTNFRYEILVHDDASTDGSADIIRDYESKYPELIKPIYQTENQYSKGGKISLRFQYPRAKGKYIAFCEGDDYWTDENKLQKQVDFLQSNPEFVLCSHKCQCFFADTKEFGITLPSSIETSFDYTIDYFIQRKEWVTQPVTIVFRKSALNLEELNKYKISKDVTLFYKLLKKGKGRFMQDCMAVYRIHDGGVWSGVSLLEKIRAELLTYLAIYEADKDEMAFRALAVRFKDVGYVGVRFLYKYYKLYFRILVIHIKNIGFFRTLPVILRSLNYFHFLFK